jgi:hypothetical protein
VTFSVDDLGRLPVGGWPDWVFSAPYLGAAQPKAVEAGPVARGANCQRYAYAVLELFGRMVPPHRSSDLWADADFRHVSAGDATDLDLVLFNATAEPWGAHVAVAINGRLLHLCREIGRPALWGWADFSERPRYCTVVGAVRVPATLVST